MNNTNSFKKYLLYNIFILLPFFQYELFAQPKNADSLFNLLSQTKDLPTQIDLLTLLANEYLRSSPDSSLYFIGKAEVLIKKINDPKREAFLINRKGLAYYDKGNLTQALFFINASLTLSEKINNKGLIGRNLGNLGLIYWGIGNTRLATDYFQKALLNFKETNNKERMAVTMNNLVGLYIEVNKQDSAVYLLEKALPLTRQYAPSILSFTMYNTGKIELSRKKYKEALYAANQALAFAQHYNDQPDLVDAYLLLAKIHFAEGYLDSALVETQKALKIAETTKRKRDMIICYELYSKLLESKKDFKNALYFNELSTIHRDTIHSETVNKALQIFEYEKQQNEIAKLTAEKTQSATEFKQKLYKQQSIIYYIILALVFTFIFTGYVLFSRHRVKKVNKNLSLAMREIQEKQEEILAQNEEIRMQQHEINHLNQHLEDLVKEKTKALFLRNIQLSEYAHFNAHKLRSPVATILGLYEVLKLTDNVEEKELIIEKLKISITQLDIMVRKSQELLNDIDGQ